METEASENSQEVVVNSDVAADHNHDNSLPDIPNHCEIVPEHDFSKQEVIGVLEAIAGTGKFWHDWNKLKYMLSFHIKQVLSEYPEATMTSEEQTLSLGETFPELVKRLDDALHTFIEGPPFTLQRLCEILLTARSIYPQLSKLALALEKNLFVTSMLTKSTESVTPVQETIVALERENGHSSGSPSNSLPNGVEKLPGDPDEIMTEVEEAEAEDGMTIDMETIEEIVQSSETSATATANAATATATANAATATATATVDS